MAHRKKRTTRRIASVALLSSTVFANPPPALDKKPRDLIINRPNPAYDTKPDAGAPVKLTPPDPGPPIIINQVPAPREEPAPVSPSDAGTPSPPKRKK